MIGSVKGLVRTLLPDRLGIAWKRVHYLRMLQHLRPEPDAAACRQYVHSGDVVLDIGANVGTYTKVLSEWVGPEGQVHALEPVPETFGYLFNNVQRLGLKNVFCYNVAASCRTGFGHITVPEYKDGGKNFHQAHLSESGISVRLFRIDDLFADISPSFIKCDVEGREVDVVNGSARIIERCRPVWLMETFRNETLEIMKSLGYTATKLEENWLLRTFEGETAASHLQEASPRKGSVEDQQQQGTQSH